MYALHYLRHSILLKFVSVVEAASSVIVIVVLVIDPTKYFGCELGAQTNFDMKNERYIVNGEHDAAKLQDILDGFIKKFVLCAACENPETTLVCIAKIFFIIHGGCQIFSSEICFCIFYQDLFVYTLELSPDFIPEAILARTSFSSLSRVSSFWPCKVNL